MHSRTSKNFQKSWAPLKMLNPSPVSFQQVAYTPHESPDHKHLNLTTSQGHYVTTLGYWFVMMNVNRDNNTAGCQRAQTKTALLISTSRGGRFPITFWARQQTVYLPISPQWNGLMPPVVQLYTRADLGLRGAREEGCCHASLHSCWNYTAFRCINAATVT